jgi:hypothetical protein
MTKKLDLYKTQFLFETNGLSQTIRMYRRKNATVLFGKNGPIRRISSLEWQALKKNFPEETKADGLYVKNVWMLEEVAA